MVARLAAPPKAGSLHAKRVSNGAQDVGFIVGVVEGGIAGGGLIARLAARADDNGLALAAVALPDRRSRAVGSAGAVVFIERDDEQAVAS